MNIDTLINHHYFHQLVLWTALGLGVGIAAKLLIPGSEHNGLDCTVIFGLAGCLLGNYLSPKIFSLPNYATFSWQGIAVGVVGAVVLVAVNRIVTKS